MSGDEWESTPIEYDGAPVEDLVYRYEPIAMASPFEEGVTDVWLYLHSGKPGPARAIKMAALADAEGVVSFEPNGEWQDVTIVDDSHRNA